MSDSTHACEIASTNLNAGVFHVKHSRFHSLTIPK